MNKNYKLTFKQGIGYVPISEKSSSFCKGQRAVVSNSKSNQECGVFSKFFSINPALSIIVSSVIFCTPVDLYAVTGGGNNVNIDSNNNMAIGNNSTATSDKANTGRAIAIGSDSAGTDGVRKTTVTGEQSIGIGTGINVTKRQSIGIGNDIDVTGEGAIALGSDDMGSLSNNLGYPRTTASGQGSVAIGTHTKSTATASLALGANANANSNYSLAMMWGSSASGENSIAVGNTATTTENNSIAIGNTAKTSGSSSVAIGKKSNASGAGSIAIGGDEVIPINGTKYVTTEATGNGAVAVGSLSKATGNASLALGSNAIANNEYSLAMMWGSSVSSNNAIAIGKVAQVGSGINNAVAIGSESVANSLNTGDYTYTAGMNNSKTISVESRATVFSIGKSGLTRQIQNVSPGVVSATSTDAINGAQLYITAENLKNYSDTVGWKIQANGAGNTKIINDNIVNFKTGDNGANNIELSLNTAGNTTTLNMYTKYFSINSTDTGNKDSLGAKGTNAMAIGPNALANGKESLALGNYAGSVYSEVNKYLSKVSQPTINQSTGEKSLSIGNYALASGIFSTSIGAFTYATSNRSLAIGSNNGHTDNAQSFTLVSGAQSVGIGSGLLVSGDQSIGIGNDIKTFGYGAVAIGGDDSGRSGYWTPTIANGNGSVALGTHSQAIGNYSLALGSDSKAGTTSETTTDGSTLTKKVAITSGEYALAIMSKSQAQKNNSIAIGYMANSANDSAIAIGQNATASNDNSVAMGSYSKTKNANTSGTYFYNPFAVTTLATNTVAGLPKDGTSGTSVFSVGDTGKERQIVNVAAGDISATSTDAINGSQLFFTAEKLKEYSNSVGWNISGTNNNTQVTNKITNDKKVKFVGGGDTTVSVENSDSDKTTTITISSKSGSTIKYFSVNSSETGNEKNDGAIATNSVAIGPNATAKSDNAIVLGNNSSISDSINSGIFGNDNKIQAFTNNGTKQNGSGKAYAIGGNNTIKNSSDTTIVGIGNQIDDAQNSFLLGNKNESFNNVDNKGLNNTQLVGNENKSTNTKNSLIFGYKNSDENSDSVFIIGRNNITSSSGGDFNETGKGSLNLIGSGNNGSGSGNSSIIGNKNISNSNLTQIFGNSNNATSSKNSIAIGNENTLTSVDSSAAFGNKNTIVKNNSFAIGNNNNVTGANTYVLGNNVVAKVSNSLYLGDNSTITYSNFINTENTANAPKNLDKDNQAGSTTTGGSNGTITKGTILKGTKKAIVYGGETGSADIFAGATSIGGVSVGYAGGERRIMNVAAGEISPTSTDAVNGSQLYAVALKNYTPYFSINSKADGNYKNDGARAENSIAIGADVSNEIGKSDFSISLGTGIKNANDSSVLIGYGAGSEVGKENDMSLVGIQAIGIGRNSLPKGNYSIALGSNSQANGEKSISLGNAINDVSKGVAIGDGAKIVGSTNIFSSVAIGADSEVTGVNTGNYVFSINSIENNDNVGAKPDNKFLTQDEYQALFTKSKDINLSSDERLNASKEIKNKSMSVFSVGSAGKERQIQNVAAGVVDEFSTDAINGSQLYYTASNLKTYADTIGFDVSDGTNNAEIDNNLTTEIDRKKLSFKSDSDNTLSVTLDKTNANEPTIKIATKTTTVSKGADGDYVADTTGSHNKDNLITAGNVASNLNELKTDLTNLGLDFTADNNGTAGKIHKNLGESLAIITNDFDDYKGTNLETRINGNSIEIGFSDKPTFSEVTANKFTAGKVTIDKDNGINAGDKKITNVETPTDDNDAANKKYVDDHKWIIAGNDGAEVNKVGKDNKVQFVNGTGTTASVTDDSGNTKVTFNVDKLSATLNNDNKVVLAQNNENSFYDVKSINTIANNIGWSVSDKNGAQNFVKNDSNVKFISGNDKTTEVVVEKNDDKTTTIKITAKNDELNAFKEKAITFKTQDGEVSKKLDETLEVVANDIGNDHKGQNLQTSIVDGKLAIGLKDNPEFNSVKVGDNNANNMVISGNSIQGKNNNANTTGIKFNDDNVSLLGSNVKLSNVAAGAISDSSKEAINGSQLHNLGNILGLNSNDTIFDNPTFTALKDKQGKNITTNQATYLNVLNSTIDRVNSGMIFADNTGENTQYLGSKLSVVGSAATNGVNYVSDNITTEYKNENGDGTITIKMSEKPTFNEVKADKFIAGDVVVDKDKGINAGNKPITNVATPTNGKDATNKDYVDAAVTNAVNGSKWEIRGNDKKVAEIGKDSKVNFANGTGTTANVVNENGATKVTFNVNLANKPTITDGVITIPTTPNVANTFYDAPTIDNMLGAIGWNVSGENNANKHLITSGNQVEFVTTTPNTTSVDVSTDNNGKTTITVNTLTASLSNDNNGKIVNPTGADKLVTAGNVANVVNTGLDYLKDLGLTFNADTGTTKQALGSTLNINAGNIDNVFVGSNLQTKAENGKIIIGFKDSPTFKDINADKVDVGGIVIEKDKGINAGNQKITNVADGNITENSKDAINGGQIHNLKNELNTSINASKTEVTGTGATIITQEVGTNNQTIYNVHVDKPIQFTTADGTQVTKVGDEFYKIKDGKPDMNSKVDSNDVVISMVNPDGTSTTPTKLTNLAKGSITDNSTDAINGSQLKDLGDKLGLSLNDTGDGFKAPNFTAITAGKNAPTTSYKDAIDDLILAMNKGRVFNADNGIITTKQLGDTLSITTGDFNFESNNVSNDYTNKNIASVVKDDKIVIGFKDKPEFSEVTIKDNNGSTVINGNSINNNGKSGIEFKDNEITLKGNGNSSPVKITNVADGNIAENSKDAINGGQIHNLKNELNTNINAAKTEVESDDKSINIAERQGDNKQTIYDLSVVKSELSISNDGKTIASNTPNNAFVTGDNVANIVNKATASARTEVIEGKNVSVVATNGADGHDIYEINVKGDLDEISSLTNGATKITLDKDKNELNVNGAKITNVADGEINANSKDAINGSQIYNLKNELNENINAAKTEVVSNDGSVNIKEQLGNNKQTIYDLSVVKSELSISGDGKTITSNTPNNAFVTGDNVANIVNKATASARTEVIEGKNVNIVSSQGLDGHDIYEINVKGDLDEISSLTNGATKITLDEDKNELNVNDAKITNVSNGDISKDSKDVINGSQLDSLREALGLALNDSKDGFAKPDFHAIKNSDGTDEPKTHKEVTAIIDDIIDTVNKGLVFNGNTGNDTNTQQNLGSRLSVIGSEKVAGENYSSNNITTTYEYNQGNGVIKIEMKKNPTFNNITANQVVANEFKSGDVVINNDGINAGGKKIQNVAAGTKQTDAANVSQIVETVHTMILGAGYELPEGKIVTVNEETGKIEINKNLNIGGTGANNINDAIASIKGDNIRLNEIVNKNKKEANAGTANALAVGNLPQSTIPGKGMFSLGYGTYNGQNAAAFGISKMSDSGKWVFKGAMSYDSQRNVGGAASVGFHW
ncbi:YadA-like family protein [Campylobacter sp. MG1]|uniref:YadA-like family protein n=1 Tax=Campylobacter sp. MG1 TaxID=2976332 RepID=UPI00226CCEE7|nr:YadA-like family protein [Campylobacter sp. MG1]